MTFKNLPTDKKEEVITSPSGSLSVTPVEADKNITKTVVLFGIKGILIVLVIGFLGWKAFDGVKSVLRVKDELFFTYQHPQLVKPMRELYILSHQKADEDLKQILTGGKE